MKSLNEMGHQLISSHKYWLVLTVIVVVAGIDIKEKVTIDRPIYHDLPILIHDGGHLTKISFNYSLNTSDLIIASFEIEEEKKAEFVPQTNTTFLLNDLTGTIDIHVRGGLIGRTYLSVFVRYYDQNPYNKSLYKSYEIITKRQDGILDTVFNVVVICLVVLANIAMGCKVELDVVKKTLKKPFAPAIGVFSQFIFMPVISFAVVYFIKMEPAIALGYFALGCSPGGSASNIYTYLFDGEISLSVTMTLVSTFASLGLIPLWLFTLGQRVIYKDSKLQIPFSNIFISLTGLLIPVIIGIIVQKKKPEWAKKILLMVKPVIIIFIVFVLTVGVYANLYIFDLLDGLILLAGALIPYLGFLFGFLLSLIARQPKKNIIAIAIETGIQNTGIPIVLLKNSLDPPESDISIIGPVAAAIFTPIPLVLILAVIQIRKRCCKKKDTHEDVNLDDEPATFTKIPDDGGSPTKTTNNSCATQND